jgi:hypothetical protein
MPFQAWLAIAKMMRRFTLTWLSERRANVSFLSDSSKDEFEAIALRNWLASEGWNDVFLDLDPERGIPPWERWERALHPATNRCEAVILSCQRTGSSQAGA